ncbi:MAG TPA: HD domain-containing phosphohydrolase [Candidatus Baltobacteraceae bacterium]|nr:HD domain-containing phosphohydrolase [Candidatus Baltobacteraceae bacterium]
MSLAEGSGPSSASESAALGDALAFFGAVADHAAGTPAAQGRLVASLAAAIAQIDELPENESDALYFAALLRNAGAIANAAFAKAQDLNDRARSLARDDIPAQGARICRMIPGLPEGCADIVRWQAEQWDGTGYPDQLRWSGVPASAQILHIAQTFVSMDDPEEALAAITSGAGRAFSPEQTRSFVMWYHMTGAEIAPAAVPVHALRADDGASDAVLSVLSESIDSHNATPGRAARIAFTTRELVRALEGSEAEQHAAALAAEIFALGELRDAQMEDEQFDPLARLGLDLRTQHAVCAADIIRRHPFLREVEPIVRARAEWFDGTGGPQRLRSGDIPLGARALSVAVAYDALEQARTTKITEDRTLPVTRLETASGTQFDPAAVRALAGILKQHA